MSRRLYEQAFLAVTGHPLRQTADMTGRTEQAILAETLALHDLDPTATAFDHFYTALTNAAHGFQDEMRARGRALPGAKEAVEALAQAGAAQSVATGNIKGVAMIKLQVFGLAAHLDFEIGGYGSDGDTRPLLIRRAISRAETKYGERIAPERVVVFGDTVLDVVAALEVGAAVVAVATGLSDMSELQAAGATAVLSDLTDTASLLNLVRRTA